MIQAPFLKSWWVEPPHLLAGCYPGDRDPREARRKLTNLLEAGIREVINLQEDDEAGRGGHPFVPYEPVLMELATESGVSLHCRRFPIPDCGVPSPELMIGILDAIDACVQRGSPVYVHCWGGHGRTATVIGCWLVRHGRTGEAALAEIRQLRRQDEYLRSQDAPQTHEQRSFVRRWHRHERGRTHS